LWASLRREWRLLRSRPRDWAMVSWVPLLAMALMCWIFSAGQPQRLPIAVWNEDGASPLSRQLVRMLEATPGLQVRQAVLNRLEAADALQRMQVHGVVHIPPGFARDVQRGAGCQRRAAAQRAAGHALQPAAARRAPGGGARCRRVWRCRPWPSAAHRPGRCSCAWSPSARSWWRCSTSPPITSSSWPPLWVPALVHILAMTAGAWSVGRELRDRTLGQWLHGAGGAAAVLAALLGKLLAPLALLWASALACLLYLSQLRGWAVAGSLAWIALGLALLVAVSLAAGAALAGLTLSLRTAMSGAGLLSAPAFAFSGVGFPLLAMSGSARTWAEAMPYTHYARLQIEQWQMGAPPAQSLPVVAGLLLATLALLALATVGLLRGLRRPERWGAR
jgi:ABC-2 type transport system permease protein